MWKNHFVVAHNPRTRSRAVTTAGLLRALCNFTSRKKRPEEEEEGKPSNFVPIQAVQPSKVHF